MKKEKNIISELQRMREMMGVKPMNRITERYVMESVNRRVRLITEASGGGDDLGERAIKSLFGDDVFAKSAAESFETGAKELSQTLEKEGLTNIDNLINKIASTKQINASDVTDEMIDDSKLSKLSAIPSSLDNSIPNALAVATVFAIASGFFPSDNVVAAETLDISLSISFVISISNSWVSFIPTCSKRIPITFHVYNNIKLICVVYTGSPMF